MFYFQDLARSKATIATLEQLVERSAEDLTAAEASLASARNAASAAAANTSTPSPELEAQLKAIQTQLAEAKEDNQDLQKALQTSQENSQSHIESITKNHTDNLMTKEESHVSALSQLRKEMEEKSRMQDEVVKELKQRVEVLNEENEKLSRVKSTGEGSGVKDEEISTLHQAHEAKLKEVEARSTQLEDVCVLFESLSYQILRLIRFVSSSSLRKLITNWLYIVKMKNKSILFLQLPQFFYFVLLLLEVAPFSLCSVTAVSSSSRKVKN